MCWPLFTPCNYDPDAPSHEAPRSTIGHRLMPQHGFGMSAILCVHDPSLVPTSHMPPRREYRTEGSYVVQARTLLITGFSNMIITPRTMRTPFLKKRELPPCKNRLPFFLSKYTAGWNIATLGRWAGAKAPSCKSHIHIRQRRLRVQGLISTYKNIFSLTSKRMLGVLIKSLRVIFTAACCGLVCFWGTSKC